MGAHLKHAGRGDAHQRVVLERIVREEPVLMWVLTVIRDLGIPDAWLVSGALYNSVWNQLTGRPSLNGVNDIDVIYFDDTDLSWDAEDRVIMAVERATGKLAVPIQTRNQARVHLWYEQKFGLPFEPLSEARESLRRYASKTHAVAARLCGDETMMLEAPFGLEDIFAFRIVPNPVADNRTTHETKGRRALLLWPELQFVPWAAAD